MKQSFNGGKPVMKRAVFISLCWIILFSAGFYYGIKVFREAFSSVSLNARELHESFNSAYREAMDNFNAHAGPKASDKKPLNGRLTSGDAEGNKDINYYRKNVKLMDEIESRMNDFIRLKNPGYYKRRKIMQGINSILSDISYNNRKIAESNQRIISKYEARISGLKSDTYNRLSDAGGKINRKLNFFKASLISDLVSARNDCFRIMLLVLIIGLACTIAIETARSIVKKRPKMAFEELMKAAINQLARYSANCFSISASERDAEERLNVLKADYSEGNYFKKANYAVKGILSDAIKEAKHASLKENPPRAMHVAILKELLIAFEGCSGCSKTKCCHSKCLVMQQINIINGILRPEFNMMGLKRGYAIEEEIIPEIIDGPRNTQQRKSI
jgi:hypothetical protein